MSVTDPDDFEAAARAEAWDNARTLTADTPTLSYVVTRTVQLVIDVTPDEAREARDMGETLTEYAAAVAECHPASAWAVVDETVTPA